jgi:hypothetical protein
VKRTRRPVTEIVPPLASEPLLASPDELEKRLETQTAALPVALDDALCLYYLCTTRCSGTKCPVFCPCDVVLDLGGIADAL